MFEDDNNSPKGDNIIEMLKNKIAYLSSRKRGVYIIKGGWEAKEFGFCIAEVLGLEHETKQVQMFFFGEYGDLYSCRKNLLNEYEIWKYSGTKIQ